jgi:uncharacterized protein YdeI (YjbR/CyaY-like superfamily)
MKISAALHVTKRDDWRAWLHKHHASKKEIWLVYFKKGSGKPCVSYEDAVEEALCFGWVDSLVHRIDEERYAQKFTPRKPGSTWSPSNLRRIAKLKKEGRMMLAGLMTLAGIEPGAEGHRSASQRAKTMPVPKELEHALRTSLIAQAFFETLAPSYRRMYIAWVSGAKKKETRERRVQETIARLAKGLKLGMK